MTQAPDKLLWRRGEVMHYLGANKHLVADLVAAGVLNPRQVNGKGRGFFLRSEVLAVEAAIKNNKQQTTTAALSRDAATGKK